MTRSIAAELLVVRKRASTWILLTIWTLLALVFAYIVPYVQYLSGSGQGTLDDLIPQNLVAQLMAGFPFFGGVIALQLGVLAFGSEYGWGTLKTLLTQRPGRLRIFAAKLLGLAATLVPFVLVVYALGALSSYVIALREGADVAWPSAWLLVRGLGDPARDQRELLRGHGQRQHDLYARVAAGIAPGAGGGDQRPRLHPVQLRPQHGQPYAAHTHHGVDLVEVADRAEHVPVLLRELPARLRHLEIPERRQELVGGRVEESTPDGVVAIFGLVSWHKTYGGRRKIDRFMLRIPVLGVVLRKIAVALLCSGITSRPFNSAVARIPVRAATSSMYHSIAGHRPM